MPKREAAMPASLAIGQKWSVWFPSRRQWLLATVTSRGDGKVTLKCDTRYGLVVGDDMISSDEATILGTSNLFRFVAPQA
jgi:hypothetical protein